MDWQVEAGKRFTVFISATTAELGDCRGLVGKILIQSGIFPVEQSDFSPDHREIADLIRATILPVDAVICLIGHAFGSSPDLLRSYTQIEFDIADQLGKPIFVFIARDDIERAEEQAEPQHLRDLQSAFRQKVIEGRRKYEWFSCCAELERQVRQAIQPIIALARKKEIRYVHPPAAPAFFVGRGDELNQLAEAVAAPAPGVIAVVGMAGQGKTTLVAHAIKTMRHLPFAGGVWVSASRGTFTFSHFLDAALEVFLGERFDKNSVPRWEARLSMLMRCLQARPLLLVIDGAERWLRGWHQTDPLPPGHESRSRDGRYEGFDEFLREASGLENGSHVILTTRALPASLDTLRCRIVPILSGPRSMAGLSGLSTDAAIELLELIGVEASRSKFFEVALTFAHHPLALTSFGSIARKLGQKWDTLAFKQSLQPSSLVQQLLEETQRHLPDAERSGELLKRAALGLENLSLDALAWVYACDADDVMSNISALAQQCTLLADWNLVIWDARSQTIGFHALIKEYFVELSTTDAARLVHSRLATWYGAQGYAPGTSLGSANNKILAVKHALLAAQPDRAFDGMFAQRSGQLPLARWMLANGHLWECAALIDEIAVQSKGMLRGECLLARAEVFHELELPQRATDAVSEALSLFAAAHAVDHPDAGRGLAKSYAVRANLHADTGSSSAAILLYDRAIELLEDASDGSFAYHLDSAKMLSNRGLARWAIGHWDAALADFSAALTLMQDSDDPDAATIAVETTTRTACVEIDFGRAHCAIERLAPFVEDFFLLRKAGRRAARASYNAATTFAAALNEAGEADRAASVVSELLSDLLPREYAEKSNFHAVLAQGLVNRGRANLLLQQLEAGLADLDEAVRLFEIKFRQGAPHLEGQLSDALFHRAEAHFRLNNVDYCSADLAKGIEIVDRWIDDWFNECNVGKNALEHALSALKYLSSDFNDRKGALLSLLAKIRARLSMDRSAPASHRRMAEILVSHEDVLNRTGRVLGIAWSR
jgi:hypothetical protein